MESVFFLKKEIINFLDRLRFFLFVLDVKGSGYIELFGGVRSGKEF